MSLSTDLSTSSSAQASSLRSSSLLPNVTRYEDLQTQATSKSKDEMGKQDFLTLFTAQLKNQDPLDPVKNEAFVAQLAQFSQLEALTNMQGSLDSFVTSMSSERLLGSASLIGKKVSVTDTATPLGSTGGIEANIELSSGATGIKLDIVDSKGTTVQTLSSGAQDPGTVQFSWDGTDANGARAAAGNYRLVASAVIDGKTTSVPVNTMTTIKSIVSNPSDGSVSLQLDGSSKTVPYKDVQRLGL